jgi:two-component system sensor histidine kinase DesK
VTILGASSDTVSDVSDVVPPRDSIWPGSKARPGRLGVVFAAVWLVFMVAPLQEGWERRDSVRGWLAIVSVVVFSAVYLFAFSVVRHRRMVNRLGPTPVQAAVLLSTLSGLGLVTCLTVGQSGMASVVYVAVASVMWLPGQASLAVVTVLAVGTDLTGRVVPGWDNDTSLPFAVCTAAFAMWGVNQLMLRNLDLIRARDDNARLAVADERNRFARDLHDILGHSLTVITVKAELANRLLDVDRERARAEITDLERLSRDALADVRRAVHGYRDLTLPGELARAREALAAADIDADLPNSTDEVPTELRELFAWTVREGVTNVIRHSGARRCVVRLGATAVEVCDDGRGPVDCPGPDGRPDPRANGHAGHGLDGLRERAAAAGAVLVTRPVEPTGFALSVLAR